MTRTEFQAAFELAHNHSLDWSQVDDSIVHGCGLEEFQPVDVTLLIVARFIRWQCLYMFVPKNCQAAQWDLEALNNVRAIARTKFRLIEDFKEAIRRGALIGASR